MGKLSKIRSELALEQVTQCLAAVDPDSAAEGLDVEGAGEGVGEAEEEHRGDPAAGVLEGEAALGQAVLADLAAAHVVHAAGGEHHGLEVARRVRPLLPRQDVEVVVCRVSSRVSLRAYR